MYLRNVNNIVPIWEKIKKHYPKDGNDPLTGFWKNESYIVEVYQSGSQMVGFVSEIPEGSRVRGWSKDQLNMSFDMESGRGVYLLGSKMPVPEEIKLNKFNHLEVNPLLLEEDPPSFSFARVSGVQK